MDARLGQELVISKCDAQGREVARYGAVVAALVPDGIVVEAEWTRGPLELGLLSFLPGDRFRETYFFARWWNTYEVQSPTGDLRGWYCNIARPARLTGRVLAFEDLALDLLVSPCGEMVLVDEAEFSSLRLTDDERAAAHAAVAEIRALVCAGAPPFARCRSHQLQEESS
ncbi:MAG: DUF402 domain-containing protein [Anaerolineae bacterium]